MRTPILSLLAVVSLSVLAVGQSTVVFFPDSSTAAGANAFPFATQTALGSAGYTVLNILPGVVLTAAGVPPGAQLSDVALLSNGGAGGTMTVGTCKILVGSMALAPQAPPALAYTTGNIAIPLPSHSAWAGNMATPFAYWDTTIDGPLVVPWAPSTFVSLPRSTISPSYAWDGVSDVVVEITHTNGIVNGFSSGSMATPTPANLGYLNYTRHGVSGVFNPPNPTTPTTTGQLEPKFRLTFSCALGFSAITGGAGIGDLSMTITGTIDPLCTEGYTLVSSTATGPLGSGGFFGLEMDASTFFFLQTPLNVGDPLHWVANVPGAWPAVPFILGPGALSGLGGQTWDAVCVVFGPGFTPLQVTCNQRLAW